MEKNDCIHASVCLVGGTGPGCNQEGSLTCGEALKRKELATRSCPLMANGKGCDNPQLLVYIPSGIDCCRNGKCLTRVIVPEIVEKVVASNGIGEPLKITPEQLKEAGRTIVSAMNLKRANPIAEKVAG
ncbi:MAG: hypothetical protein WC582_04300 [Patescibacteria group bacterium]